MDVGVPELGSIKSDTGAILVKFLVGHHNPCVDNVDKDVISCRKFVVVDIVLALAGFV